MGISTLPAEINSQATLLGLHLLPLSPKVRSRVMLSFTPLTLPVAFKGSHFPFFCGLLMSWSSIKGPFYMSQRPGYMLLLSKSRSWGDILKECDKLLFGIEDISDNYIGFGCWRCSQRMSHCCWFLCFPGLQSSFWPLYTLQVVWFGNTTFFCFPSSLFPSVVCRQTHTSPYRYLYLIILISPQRKCRLVK